MTSENKTKKIFILIIALAAAVVLIWAGCRFYMEKQADSRSREVLDKMETLIPGMTGDEDFTSEAGRDPLAALSIDGIDIVGCLEIPSLSLKTPVTGKNTDERGFITWISGSPVKGKFRLSGSSRDVFRDLTDAKPGAEVLFTDVDGIKYRYKVTTQYHLKNWDKADNDLLLCYESDKNTDFVLGCMTDL